MRLAVAIAALVTCAAMPFAVWGQQAPAPLLHVAVDPLRVVVGRPVTLTIDALVPNYMTGPPELPGFQVRNAVTRQLQSVNISDQRNGMTYAGVRFAFEFYPQEPGSYAIADQTIKLKYAAEPPASREDLVAMPRVSFEAFIPDAAANLTPFLAATGLTAEQSIQRSSEQLKVGDSVTRTVTVHADETPAMLLPPVTFAAIDGLAVYPAQPRLQDKTEGRTDALSATRTDTATYMLQRAGSFVLPAITLDWWNAGSGRIETARLDAVSIEVAVNPALESAATGALTRWSGRVIVDLILEHWALVLLALIVFAALAWTVPRLVRAISTDYRRRRELYFRSERFSFDRLRRATRRGDARQSYFALLEWLQRFEPLAAPRTIGMLEATARDPVLGREIATLERKLFDRKPATVGWSSRRMLRSVAAARRNLQGNSNHSRKALPSAGLNPGGNDQPRGGRRPAR